MELLERKSQFLEIFRKDMKNTKMFREINQKQKTDFCKFPKLQTKNSMLK